MMRKMFAILLSLIMLSVLAACSGRGIISKKKMAEINAELFLVDEWLLRNQRYGGMADTSFVYAGVFEKYGCTGEDYMRSLDYYMLDADRYVKILKKSRSILEKREKEVIALMLRDDSERRADFILDSIIRSLPPVGYLPHFTDSIGILSVDSLGGIHIVTDSVFVLEDTMKYILNDHLNDLL